MGCSHHAEAQTQGIWSPAQVFYNEESKLSYFPDEKGNVIPDFSNVGYEYGDNPIPDVHVVIEVNPVEGDDGATIQAAIDRVGKMHANPDGIKGAVLLKKGIYEVSGQLILNTGGVVLRGEGQTDTGTVIIATGTEKRSLIEIGNGSELIIDEKSGVAVTEDYVPVGRKYVIVSDASSYVPGDHIALYRPATRKWISDLKMDQITNTDGERPWRPEKYNFFFERLVTKVSGDTIFFRNPVVMALDQQYGGGLVYKADFHRMQQVGIENLCLKSEYAHETDEKHAWNAIEIQSAENCWVKNVTSWYFGYACVDMRSSSRLITVDSCNNRQPVSIITGGRRYPFHISGSLCLVKNCTSSDARHDYANGGRVCGPNVFTNCTAIRTHSDIGPHHRWCMGTLFDNIVTTGQINVQDRDNMGSGHGWSGANMVFWNCRGKSAVCQSPWVSAKNYNFGFIGNKKAGYREGRPDGVWVGHNKPGIFPSSLYQAQLEERIFGKPLKEIPDNKITILENRP